jgi:hypothetical protein
MAYQQNQQQLDEEQAIQAGMGAPPIAQIGNAAPAAGSAPDIGLAAQPQFGKGEGGGTPQPAQDPAPAAPPQQLQLGVKADGTVGTVAPVTTTTDGSSYKEVSPELAAARTAQGSAFDTQVQAEDASLKAKLDEQGEMAKLAREQVDKQIKFNAAKLELVQKAQDREEAARAQVRTYVDLATKDPPKFWDDKTNGQRIMARVGIWLSAFGQALGGGDNQALKNINDLIERDAKAKQIKQEKLFKLASIHQGFLADAYEQRAKELGSFDANVAAGQAIAAKQAELIHMRFVPPALKAESLEKVGKIKETAAQKSIDTQTQTARDIHHSVAVAEPRIAPQQPNSNARVEAVATQEKGRIFRVAADIAEKNPAAWTGVQAALKAELEAKALREGGLKGFYSLLRSGGISPSVLDQRLKTQDERLIARAMILKQAVNAKTVDPSGAISDKTLDIGAMMDSPNSMTVGEMSTSFRDAAGFADRMAAAADPGILQKKNTSGTVKGKVGPKGEPPNLTVKQLINAVPSDERVMYNKARMIPKGHKDYDEAQAYIKQLNHTYDGSE